MPNITPSNPGKRINFVSTPAAQEHPDQFAPYKVFGCDARKPFQGTLFRFPLRTPAHAQASRISKQVTPCQNGTKIRTSSAFCKIACIQWWPQRLQRLATLPFWLTKSDDA